MSTKWAMLKAIQREPDNALHCYAMADLLEVVDGRGASRYSGSLRQGEAGASW
jgi:hypothetical protein